MDTFSSFFFPLSFHSSYDIKRIHCRHQATLSLFSIFVVSTLSVTERNYGSAVAPEQQVHFSLAVRERWRPYLTALAAHPAGRYAGAHPAAAPQAPSPAKEPMADPTGGAARSLHLDDCRRVRR